MEETCDKCGYGVTSCICNEKVCQTCGGDPERHDMMCKGTKKMPDVQRYLTAKEYLMYHSSEGDTEAYESLAATRKRSEQRRVLLEKLQFSETYYGEPKRACPACGCNEYHTADCELAQAIEKGE